MAKFKVGDSDEVLGSARSLDRCFLLPQFCFAYSGIIVKESLWRQIAEDNQTAVVKINGDGFVDVSLFISIVDKSEKSNIIHLVLPFYNRPISFQAEELVLADFKKMVCRSDYNA